MPFWSVNTAVWLVLILIFGIKKGTVIQNLAILGDDRLMLCDATGIKKNKDLMRRIRHEEHEILTYLAKTAGCFVMLQVKC